MDINIQQKDIALIFLQLSPQYSESIDTDSYQGAELQQRLKLSVSVC